MSELQQFVNNQVPEGWTTKPFWSMFRRVKYTNFPNEELLSVYRDYGVIPKSSRDDNHNKASEDLSNYQLIDKGWLVTNKMKAWQGSIAISRHRGIVSPAYYAYKPLSKEHDQFLHYLLRSDPYIALYKRISKGVRVNQWDLEHDALRTAPILLPSYDVQKKIAYFLDQETARIDQLIEKKKGLIEALDIRMDSKINEVFKDLPTQRRLKNIANVQLSNVDKHIFEDEIQVTACHYTDVYYNDIITEETELRKGSVTPLEYKRFILTGGEVIITKDSESTDDIGIPAFVQSTKENTVCGYHLSIITAFPKLADGGYIFWALKTKHVRDYFMLNAQGVTRYGLPLGKISDCPVPYTTDIQEQKGISNQLFSLRKIQLDTSKKIEASIQRLKEIKTSLITEAVTGQLDIERWKNRNTVDRRLDKIEEEMAS